MDAYIETVSCLMPMSLSLVKYLNCLLQIREMRELLENLYDNWIHFNKQLGFDTLETYMKNSKTISLFYTFYMFSSLVVYLLLPIGHVVYDTVKNNTKQPLFQAEYFVDEQEYFYPLLVHDIIGTVVVVIISVAADTMYLVCVIHACGLYALIGKCISHMLSMTESKSNTLDVFVDGSFCRHQLRHLYDQNCIDTSTDRMELKESNVTRNAVHAIYSRLVLCIKGHQRVIRYSNRIESSFTLSFLVQLIINVFTLSVSGVQTVSKLNQTDEAIRFGILTVGLTVHLFFLNYPGQILLNHSDKIFIDAYMSEWYKFSSNSTINLKFLLLKSLTAEQLTAGKLIPLSLNTFASVVQTAMSYFTILLSFR